MVRSSSKLHGQEGGSRTSNSFKVNICFKITTFSNLEFVSAIMDGSSSSQSANLLLTHISKGPYQVGQISPTYLFSFCVLRIIFCLSLMLACGGASRWLL